MLFNVTIRLQYTSGDFPFMFRDRLSRCPRISWDINVKKKEIDNIKILSFSMLQTTDMLSQPNFSQLTDKIGNSVLHFFQNNAHPMGKNKF